MALATPREQARDRDESAALYRLIAETIPHMVWTARADGSLDFFNRRCYEYTGLDASGLAGWAWRSVIHPEDRAHTVGAWTRALQSGERFEIEYRLRRADGVYRWHQGSAVPLRGADGRVARWFGTCTDIELQIRSARMLEAMVEERTQALRDNERRFQLFMDHVPALAWIRDAQLRHTFVNRAYAKERGRTPAELLGSRAADDFPREIAERFSAIDRQVQHTGMPMQYVDSLPTGTWLKIKFPFPDPSGGIGVAGIALEVTERARLEQALAESERRYRALAGRLIAAQESERRQLADELHDLIGQNLTALGIDLMALKSRLQPVGDAAAAQRLDAMRSLIESTIDSIRGVMTGLRPPALEEFGLVPALQAHAAEFAERTGIRVEVGLRGSEARPAREIELALFRIVQEALTNVAKHSGASAVEIRIACGAERITVTVQDDGCGFPAALGPRGTRGGGWGVPEMRERAEERGGTLRIESPGRGARLVAEIPIKLS